MPEVRRFAEQIYKEYWVKYGARGIPQEMVAQFCSEYERDFGGGGVRDMYKEVMFHMMIGSNFKTANDELFWDNLLPAEIEN